MHANKTNANKVIVLRGGVCSLSFRIIKNSLLIGLLKSSLICSIQLTMKIELPTTPEWGAFCRICHEKTPQKDLITPCNCMGSVSWVHRKCLERWLTVSHRNTCEICDESYTCVQTHPHVFLWLKNFPKPVITDALLCSFLTPLAVVSIILCFRAAIAQVKWENAIQSLCLFALGSFLLGVYLAWIGLTIRSHCNTFLEWRSENPLIKIIWPLQPKKKLDFVAVQYMDDEVLFISSSIPHSIEIHSPSATISTHDGSFRTIRLRSSCNTPRPGDTV